MDWSSFLGSFVVPFAAVVVGGWVTIWVNRRESKINERVQRTKILKLAQSELLLSIQHIENIFILVDLSLIQRHMVPKHQ